MSVTAGCYHNTSLCLCLCLARSVLISSSICLYILFFFLIMSLYLCLHLSICPYLRLPLFVLCADQIENELYWQEPTRSECCQSISSYPIKNECICPIHRVYKVTATADVKTVLESAYWIFKVYSVKLICSENAKLLIRFCY